jgi:hypothetical protein
MQQASRLSNGAMTTLPPASVALAAVSSALSTQM